MVKKPLYLLQLWNSKGILVYERCTFEYVKHMWVSELETVEGFTYFNNQTLFVFIEQESGTLIIVRINKQETPVVTQFSLFD